MGLSDLNPVTTSAQPGVRIVMPSDTKEAGIGHPSSIDVSVLPATCPVVKLIRQLHDLGSDHREILPLEELRANVKRAYEFSQAQVDRRLGVKLAKLWVAAGAALHLREPIHQIDWDNMKQADLLSIATNYNLILYPLRPDTEKMVGHPLQGRFTTEPSSFRAGLFPLIGGLRTLKVLGQMQTESHDQDITAAAASEQINCAKKGFSLTSLTKLESGSEAVRAGARRSLQHLTEDGVVFLRSVAECLTDVAECHRSFQVAIAQNGGGQVHWDAGNQALARGSSHLLSHLSPLFGPAGTN